MADARAREALQRAVSRRADSSAANRKSHTTAQLASPSAEEIVERYGPTIVTRNAYGARCLNTPNVLFVDVDAEPAFPAWVLSGVAMVAMGAGGYAWWRGETPGMALSLWVVAFIVVATASTSCIALSPAGSNGECGRRGSESPGSWRRTPDGPSASTGRRPACE